MVIIPSVYKSQKMRGSILGNVAIAKDKSIEANLVRRR